MPREAHTKAAEHHENAAKSHRTAADITASCFVVLIVRFFVLLAQERRSIRFVAEGPGRFYQIPTVREPGLSFFDRALPIPRGAS